jgi:aspartate/methionine/tyrosine aminotransferase
MDFHKENSYDRKSDNMKNLLFTDVNIDNVPQEQLSCSASFAQKYNNQVIATILNPKLLQSEEILPEAKEKAQNYLKIKNFSVGAYSDSKGLALSRKNIANWYYERDGHKIEEDDIFLVNGGINGYDHAVNVISNPGDSILMPNPCYPFYLNFNKCANLENVFYQFTDIEHHSQKCTIDVNYLLYIY